MEQLALLSEADVPSDYLRAQCSSWLENDLNGKRTLKGFFASLGPSYAEVCKLLPEEDAELSTYAQRVHDLSKRGVWGCDVCLLSFVAIYKVYIQVFRRQGNRYFLVQRFGYSEAENSLLIPIASLFHVKPVIYLLHVVDDEGRELHYESLIPTRCSDIDDDDGLLLISQPRY